LIKVNRLSINASLNPGIDALKLRVASTATGSFCYSQVVAYVPYEFINASKARKHTPEEAQIVLSLPGKQK
jgi:hypothetical protein